MSRFFLLFLFILQAFCFTNISNTSFFIVPLSAEYITDLKDYEQRIYSQNGEDGVLVKIFELIGTKSMSFVEFGVHDGIECNTRYLREFYNWNGLMMDAGFCIPEINLQKEMITVENIHELFVKYNVPEEFDLLSIDIDFNDFYVMSKILEKYYPRVIVIEYNATHLPHEDKVINYSPFQFWDGTNYFGASILSFYKLARKNNYSLVYADNNGVNLFFVRDDILQEKNVNFINTNDVEKIYKYPRYGSGPNSGHPSDPQARPFVSADELLE